MSRHFSNFFFSFCASDIITSLSSLSSEFGAGFWSMTIVSEMLRLFIDDSKRSAELSSGFEQENVRRRRTLFLPTRNDDEDEDDEEFQFLP